MQRGKCAQAFCIFLQTTGEALVGEVKQRQPAFIQRQLRQLLPLFQRRINAGWVMAAAVEQNDIARLRLRQAVQQAVKVQRMVLCVVIGIFTHFQTRRIEYALMVRPAWIAHPDAFYIGIFSEKIRCHTQCAGAARGLGSAGAFVGDKRIAFAE